MFIPRPRQQEVLAYRRGTLGIAAVPGSGKTHVLSGLAAGLIASAQLAEDQEILIVTLVNSAVDNFAHRIAAFLQEGGLSPRLNYRVRTLHGLAHDILRERPDLAGLGSDFKIIAERPAEQLRQAAGLAWLKAHPAALSEYLNPELSEEQRLRLRRRVLPELVDEIALSWIGSAKDAALSPADLLARLNADPTGLPLARLGAAIYSAYQRALADRSALDFDDLIRLALQVLQSDSGFLERLRRRWPYILEDEAQDSSRLQQQILQLLAGPGGNWVRVGDPNQAIFETFTTASPQYLRDFLHAAQVAIELPNSGRSTPAIIDLANRLIDWTRTAHPVKALRAALALPYIEPAPAGDPQPNPPDSAGRVIFHDRPFSPPDELQAVVDSLARWLPDHPEATVAALVPRNLRGFELVNELKRRKIETVELLRSTTATRRTAGYLEIVINYLADPQSSTRLAAAYRVWRLALKAAGAAAGATAESTDIAQTAALAGPDASAEPAHQPADPRRAAEMLRKCRRVEEFVWPHPGRDYLDTLPAGPAAAPLRAELLRFRAALQRWLGMALLPAGQLVLALSQDLFRQPADLATAYKLAALLEQTGAGLPTSGPFAFSAGGLPELSQELAAVARNERRFLGFSEDDIGFDPSHHRGKVVVTTIHKAKGLEWDRVYLLSVNDADFPSGLATERSIAERWFIRDRLNLPAEALAQLQALLPPDAPLSRARQSTDAIFEASAAYGTPVYTEGLATRQARLDYAAERLRLLYVAITRARCDLIITWNSGSSAEHIPALPLRALFPPQDKDQAQ